MAAEINNLIPWSRSMTNRPNQKVNSTANSREKFEVCGELGLSTDQAFECMLEWTTQWRGKFERFQRLFLKRLRHSLDQDESHHVRLICKKKRRKTSNVWSLSHRWIKSTVRVRFTIDSDRGHVTTVSRKGGHCLPMGRTWLAPAGYVVR